MSLELTHSERRALREVVACKTPLPPSGLASLLAGTMDGVGVSDLREAAALLSSLETMGLVSRAVECETLAFLATPVGRQVV